ncbi:MAG: hypothetical protein CSA33_07895 [Desulfobulbus propionicus]|nr:MAG: hypothetical protein CSA33_07895 [Desulfobulbus propionicus]
MKNPIVKRCAGLDIHKMRVAATLQLLSEDGNVAEETRSFATFRKHRRQLCRWLKKIDIELVVMASSAIFFKSIYESLENATHRRSWSMRGTLNKFLAGKQMLKIHSMLRRTDCIRHLMILGFVSGE